MILNFLPVITGFVNFFHCPGKNTSHHGKSPTLSTCSLSVFHWLLTIIHDIIDHLLLDAFLTKRAEEVERLSAQLASTTSLVHNDLSDVDEAQNSASQELTANLDQLLQHCSQTKVCTTVSLCRIRTVLDGHKCLLQTAV